MQFIHSFPIDASIMQQQNILCLSGITSTSIKTIITAAETIIDNNVLIVMQTAKDKYYLLLDDTRRLITVPHKKLKPLAAKNRYPIGTYFNHFPGIERIESFHYTAVTTRSLHKMTRSKSTPQIVDDEGYTTVHQSSQSNLTQQQYKSQHNNKLNTQQQPQQLALNQSIQKQQHQQKSGESASSQTKNNFFFFFLVK